MLLGVDVEDELNKLIEDQLAHYSAAGIKKPPPFPIHTPCQEVKLLVELRLFWKSRGALESCGLLSW